MAKPGDALYDTILDLEEQTWKALEDGGSGLIPYLSADCVMLLPGTTVISETSKPSIREILSRDDVKPWTYYELRNVHVIPIGAEGASISYIVRAERGKMEYTALITSIWRNTGDGWRLVTHQQTPLEVET